MKCGTPKNEVGRDVFEENIGNRRFGSRKGTPAVFYV